MRSSFIRVSVTVLALAASAAPALAGQSRPVTDFNGTYVLACDRIELTLHASAAGTIAGQSASWSGTIGGDFDCSDGEALAAVGAEAGASCRAAGLPAAGCDELDAGIVRALEGAVALVPVEMTARVSNPWDFWARLFGVYQVSATHRLASGAQAAGTYYLDNNDGRDGTFATMGLGLNGAAGQSGVGCVDLTAGAIDGRIRRDDAYSLTATAAIDRSVTCLAVGGVDAVALNLGLSVRVYLDGIKE